MVLSETTSEEIGVEKSECRTYIVNNNYNGSCAKDITDIIEILENDVSERTDATELGAHTAGKI